MFDLFMLDNSGFGQPFKGGEVYEKIRADIGCIFWCFFDLVAN